MNEFGAVPCVQARASSACVLVPLTEISCALPRSALKKRAGAEWIAQFNARELPVLVVSESLGLQGQVGPRSVVLVHERSAGALGLLVDSVGAVLWISAQQRLPLPESAQFAAASAVVQTELGLAWLVEPEKFWLEGREPQP